MRQGPVCGMEGGDARSLGQLAAHSRGPAPTRPCCNSVMRRASRSPCADIGPQYQLCTPRLAQPRGRIPWDAHPDAPQGLVNCESAPAAQPREDRGLLDVWMPSAWGLCPCWQPLAPSEAHTRRSQASRQGVQPRGITPMAQQCPWGKPAPPPGRICLAASTHLASGASPPGRD